MCSVIWLAGGRRGPGRGSHVAGEGGLRLVCLRTCGVTTDDSLPPGFVVNHL